tara:strand:- start:277 stop:528 length:252 start_codon:yes stop_codon:yes gene_type:complete
MNERIKQLAVEAKLIVAEPNGFDPTTLSFAQQLFAHLIVSRCIALMDVNYRGDMYTGDLFACEYNNCINEQVETLEDYFGANK